MTPTARTLAHCRKNGWLADVVERRLPYCRTTKDLFGFIDVVALAEGRTLGIQTTSRSNHAARVRKIKEQCRDDALAWLAVGNAIEVWSWGKVGRRWQVRTTEIVAADFD